MTAAKTNRDQTFECQNALESVKKPKKTKHLLVLNLIWLIGRTVPAGGLLTVMQEWQTKPTTWACHWILYICIFSCIWRQRGMESAGGRTEEWGDQVSTRLNLWLCITQAKCYHCYSSLFLPPLLSVPWQRVWTVISGWMIQICSYLSWQLGFSLFRFLPLLHCITEKEYHQYLFMFAWSKIFLQNSTNITRLNDFQYLKNILWKLQHTQLRHFHYIYSYCRVTAACSFFILSFLVSKLSLELILPTAEAFGFMFLRTPLRDKYLYVGAKTGEDSFFTSQNMKTHLTASLDVFE